LILSDDDLDDGLAVAVALAGLEGDLVRARLEPGYVGDWPAAERAG
jgi:hypothetical protein